MCIRDSSQPGPPGDVTAVKMTNVSCTVAWTDGAFYGLRIERYRIEGRTDHNQTWRVLADHAVAEQIDFQGTVAKIDGRRQFRLINKLTPWSAYSFRVAAYNDLGLGEWSEPSPSYNTRPGLPLKSVTNIRTGEGGRTGDLLVKWDPLAREDQNAPGVYYKLYYKKKGEVGDNFKVTISSEVRRLGNIGKYTVRINPEDYWTPYIVKIQAFNDKCVDTEGCEGPMSPETEVMSAEDIPRSTPTNVGARPFNSTAIRVHWNPVPNIRDKVLENLR